MITIGLTGDIAAGKTEVSRLLAAHGARVVDADKEAHQTYAPGQPGHGLLVEAFGDEILGADGAVDRRKLGDIVFANPGSLLRLNAIVWPLTRRRVEIRKAEAERDGVEVLVIEAPLLVEAGWQDFVDQIWFVRTSSEAAMQRLRSRGLSEEDARARLAVRPEVARTEAEAHVVIENSGSLNDLEQRIDSLWRVLQHEAI